MSNIFLLITYNLYVFWQQYFKVYIPNDLISNPREDKSYTIRRMAEQFRVHNISTQTDPTSIDFVPTNQTDDTNLDSDETSSVVTMSKAVDFSQPDEPVDIFGLTRPRSYFLSWLTHLPTSLRAVYDLEMQRLEEGLPAPPPLGTQPLKDLVRQIHQKGTSVLKYL